MEFRFKINRRISRRIIDKNRFILELFSDCEHFLHFIPCRISDFKSDKIEKYIEKYIERGEEGIAKIDENGMTLIFKSEPKIVFINEKIKLGEKDE